MEKYRKLAQDAHLNGDRVQAEYYLQFADHYFRVIADQRVRQEEQRAARRVNGGRKTMPRAKTAAISPATAISRALTSQIIRASSAEERQQREERPRREEREEPREEVVEQVQEVSAEREEEGNSFEPAENPFLRENATGADCARAASGMSALVVSARSARAVDDRTSRLGSIRPHCLRRSLFRATMKLPLRPKPKPSRVAVVRARSRPATTPAKHSNR